MKYMNQGRPVTPEQLLDRREERGLWLEAAAIKFPSDTLVCFKLNIPGPIKTNPLIRLVFAKGRQQILDLLPPALILDEINGISGPEMVLKTPMDGASVKATMIHLEENSPLGRVFDIDVFSYGKAISRETLALPERKCLICSNSAKGCSRSQAHSLEEILEVTEMILLSDPSILMKHLDRPKWAPVPGGRSKSARDQNKNRKPDKPKISAKNKSGPDPCP